MKVISIPIILIFSVIVVGLGHAEIQEEKSDEQEQIRSIEELERKIESNYQGLLSRISELKKETDNKITKLLTQHSLLQEEFNDNHKSIIKIISENDKKINRQIKAMQANYQSIQQEFEELSKNQDILKKQQSSNYQSLNEHIDSLKTDYKDLNVKVDELNDDTSKHITIIKKDVLLKFFFTSLAILLSLSITIFTAFILKKRFKKANLLEESIKLDSRMSEILENQLILMKKESIEKEAFKPAEKIDHALPIRVGEEIFRMRKRIKNMDENVKGINALKNALSRLEDEFNNQGYSIRDLTGQVYEEELTVKIVNVIKSENLEPEKKVISRMIAPQIFYKGTAVSHGEAELLVSSEDYK